MVPPEPDIPANLTAITGQMQLLQRRLLRADGLMTLERDFLLSTVADTLAIVQRLNEQVARYLALQDTPPR